MNLDIQEEEKHEDARANNSDSLRIVPIPRFRCLIANDDLLQLTMLEAIFEKHLFEVVTAQNGQLAFQAVLKSRQNPCDNFDLILLDLNMPVSSGFEACKNIMNLFQNSID